MLPFIYIGSLALPSFGLCMAAGIVVAVLVSYFRFRKRGGSFDSLLMVVAVAMAIGLACAKISFFIFSYGLDKLFKELLAGNFSGFNNVGLIYYGGLVGGIFGALITVKLNKYNFDAIANAVIPCIPLGHAFGRIGCLFAGCCYGLHYDGLFAVHSANIGTNEWLFPIQAIEALFNFTLFIFLTLFTKREHKGVITLYLYIMLYSVARFILEFFRGDLIRGIYWGISTSQWISILLVIACIILLFVKVKMSGKEEQAYDEKGDKGYVY